MIVVTGTKRSGTSMWMQILTASGLNAFGEAFPRDWKASALRQANPHGFYESLLRRGIHWQTNPHPKTGAYIFPDAVTQHVVKVFIPGLVRTDRAFVGKVLATLRHWREYETSVNRLYELEREGRPSPPPPRMPPRLEWWLENFALVRDAWIRRYPIHVQSYQGLVEDPRAVIRDTLKWLGVEGLDLEAAVAAVRPDSQTQRHRSVAAEDDIEAMFDELYFHLHERKPTTRAFLRRLNEANAVLAPKIRAAQEQLVRARVSPGADNESARAGRRFADGMSHALELVLGARGFAVDEATREKFEASPPKVLAELLRRAMVVESLDMLFEAQVR